MLFHDFLQKLQRKVYETELINLILNNVLPRVSEMFNSNSKEIVLTYKLITTIAQIINLKVPVLAVTESED